MIDESDQHQNIRNAVRSLCRQFPDEYFRKVDEQKAYPEAFVDALMEAGWLAAMIPEEYGGPGLGLTEATVIMEEINRSGGNSGAVHGQMYNMGTLLRSGSKAQKEKYLPDIAAGKLRIQSMGVTEPTTGTDTTKIKTTAVKKDGRYVVNGQKVWISRVQHSDLMILLARTTPLPEVKKKSEGMSIFIVDLHHAIGNGLTVRPIPNLVNHETNELFFDNLEIPEENLIGEEGRGFKYILDGLNAERTLIAAECIGDGYWFIDRATAYANERIVFDRPIGKNQGVQFPIADAYIEIEAANLMRFKACELFDAGKPSGTQANMAKYLAAKASWEAANVCMQTHGGFGFANEYDIERKFRETRLYQVAPISTNLIFAYIAEHVLGLPQIILMNLTDWIGRTETVQDVVTATPYAAISATLDRDPERPPPGTPLPPLWHWLYFLPLHRRSEVGPDGHAKKGGFLPPTPLPRRMWAGSQFEFRAPLRVGDSITRVSTIESVSEKDGRTGPLIFVKVRHDIGCGDDTDVAIVEHHDIVYREAAKPGEVAPPPATAPANFAWERKWVPDDVLLFRYSALTFNGHRIHYDRRYVTEVEGYPGLIVHGPLLATLMLDLLRHEHPDAVVARYAFKAMRPVFDIHSFHVCGQPQPRGKTMDLWVRDHEGALAMSATAEIR